MLSAKPLMTWEFEWVKFQKMMSIVGKTLGSPSQEDKIAFKYSGKINEKKWDKTWMRFRRSDEKINVLKYTW